MRKPSQATLYHAACARWSLLCAQLRASAADMQLAALASPHAAGQP